MDIWSNLRTFGLFYGHYIGLFYGHLVYFTDIWSILRTFGLFYGHWSILRTFGPYNGHLVYFTDIWYILRQFGILCGHLVYVSRFGTLYLKNLATLNYGGRQCVISDQLSNMAVDIFSGVQSDQIGRIFD
jgi:hypothetical protein